MGPQEWTGDAARIVFRVISTSRNQINVQKWFECTEKPTRLLFIAKNIQCLKLQRSLRLYASGNLLHDVITHKITVHVFTVV
jgi:hypothetical protein